MEAARAGEQGRGFAVRGHGSTHARRTFGHSCEGNQGAHHQQRQPNRQRRETGCRRWKDDAGNRPQSRARHEIERVTKLVGEIAIASRGQSSEIDAVDQAVSQMDTVTRLNAALAEEAAAAQTMAAEVQTLREGVSLFKLK